MRGRRLLRAGAILAGCCIVLPALLSAQDYFGKNKVQYRDFKWSFIQSDHFDVYFYQGGEPLAEFSAAELESAYTSVSKLFRYQIVNRVPFVVYNSHNDFQQTNVVYEYMEEGIGGVTELFKNRVVVPFEGDYRKFRHVLHHELVHAVVNDMFYGGSIQSIISNNITLSLPLWFNEGLAEYAALRWDTNSDMYIRDAAIHQSLPAISQLWGYAAYRGGQSVWYYIAGKYGEEKIGEILNRIKSTRSVEAGFRASIGLSVEELSERWQKESKVIYWPDIAKREDPADYGRRLTDHKKEGGFYNTSPTITPQGDKIAFISNRHDFFDVFLMNAADGRIITKLVDGQQTENLEELHLLTPGLSWSPDGKTLALATKAGAEDAIILIDAETRNYGKLTFGLEGIFSIAWSPKGDKIAFSGAVARQSDIFMVDTKTGVLTNLTDDIFSDFQPAWTPDGSALVFSSDRGVHVRPIEAAVDTLEYNQTDLYRIDVATQAVTRLTDWPNSDESTPVVSPDGKKMIFVSDRNGITNMYVMHLETGAFRPITNSLSGVYQPSISRDGTKLAFASLSRSGFDIFMMRNPFDRDLGIAELEPTEFFKNRFAASKHTVPGVPPVTGEPAPAAADSTKMLGENIEIDFSNYVVKDDYDVTVPSESTMAQLPKITNNLDEKGKYKINKYKLNFTPDIIYGNAGYNTFYGVTGSTVLAFSDLLGDHQIILSTNLLIDLKNSDYGLQYYYLPNRIDFGFGGSHSARFLYLFDQYGQSLYRFRTYGLYLTALAPLSRYTRFEFGLNWYNVSKENMDRVDEPTELRTIILPSIGYVYDTILWGYTSPITGTRYRIDMFGTPRVGKDGLSFVNVQLDYRTYLRLGQLYSWAFRVAGGMSLGPNPQKYMVGGVENWIAPVFEGGAIPISDATDFLFLKAGLPLRGYDYNAQIGTRYWLFNTEIRFPLFAFLQAGPIPLGQSIGGALFLDAGSAWTDDQRYALFEESASGSLQTRDLLIGMGGGTRILLLWFLLRFDVAWAWNIDRWSPPKYYFSFGADF